MAGMLLGGGLMGNPLSGALGGGGEEKEEKSDAAGAEGEEDPEIAEARREAEEKRKEKHRKMEEEREAMRQEIRDKYNIKKREEPQMPVEDPNLAGRLGRKKKTPAEMAAEQAAAEEEEDSILPGNFNDFTNKVKDLPNSAMAAVSGVADKCLLM